MGKIRFRDSLANMLGEFVFLQKSPDYRPNAQSTQYIREAIRSEIDAKKYKSSHLFENNNYSQPIHFRTSSTNSGYRNMPRTPTDDYLTTGRRQSLPGPGKFQNVLQRLRGSKKGRYDIETYHNEIRDNGNENYRRNSVISESDEATISFASSRRASQDSCHEQIQGLSMKL